MNKLMGLMLASAALFLLSFQDAKTQTQVLSALKSGNAVQMAKYFDSRVDISLPGKTDNYSRNQAEMVLKEFFSQNPVKSFVVKHQGENNGSQFWIGSLQTKNGNFRTKLYMKPKGDDLVVQEMAFQPER